MFLMPGYAWSKLVGVTCLMPRDARNCTYEVKTTHTFGQSLLRGMHAVALVLRQILPKSTGSGCVKKLSWRMKFKLCKPSHLHTPHQSLCGAGLKRCFSFSRQAHMGNTTSCFGTASGRHCIHRFTYIQKMVARPRILLHVECRGQGSNHQPSTLPPEPQLPWYRYTCCWNTHRSGSSYCKWRLQGHRHRWVMRS